MADTLIDTHPGILDETSEFSGTRVPARTLLKHLVENDRLDEFLDDDPTVSTEQVVDLLERKTTILA